MSRVRGNRFYVSFWGAWIRLGLGRSFFVGWDKFVFASVRLGFGLRLEMR